jgi:hypothetical protein
MQKCEGCGKKAYAECTACNTVWCEGCVTEAIRAGECNNGGCGNSNPPEGFVLVEASTCHLEGCSNVALVGCFGCGMKHCGQHGLCECPVCHEAISYLKPAEGMPWYEVWAKGFEASS